MEYENYLTYEVLGECIDSIIYDYDIKFSNLGHGENYLMGMVDMYTMLKENDYIMGMTEINALEYLINKANGAIETYSDGVDHWGWGENLESECELRIRDLRAEIEVLTKAINEISDLLDKCAEELLNN